jgi:hypothetical protein
MQGHAGTNSLETQVFGCPKSGNPLSMRLTDRGYLSGERSALRAAVRLGVILPLILSFASVVSLGVINRVAPQWQSNAVLMLIILWLISWLYASVAIFRCALNERKNTWFAGVLLFVVPFIAWSVISGLFRNLDGVLFLAK